MTITQNGVLKRDDNDVPVMGGTSSSDNATIINAAFDPVTRRLLTDSAGGGTGTVTSITAGTGLTATPTNPITTVGTILLDSKLAPLDTLGTAGQLIRVNAGATALEYFTSSGGGVASVSGTANRIAVNNTDPANPIVDIDAAYVGQTSITTLGTITTGTWSGTTVAIAHGGTGQTSKSAAFDALSPMTTGGDIIYGGASGTGTRLANGNAGQVLTSGGTTVAPTWATPTTGTVTAVSVASANGFAGSSSGGATPALTISTSINSPVLAGNGTAITAATTTGTGSTVVLATGPTMTNPVVGTQTTTDNSTKAASTAYVTTAISNAISGVNPAVAVQAATTSAGNTSGFTYNNGVSGVGATFTGTTNTAVTIDGFTFTTLGQRLLVKNDTQSPSGAFNGVYYVTQVQTSLLPPILTRALDYDTPSDINNTGAIPVVNGTVNANTSWLLTSTVATVGTDPLTYVQFSLAPSSIATLAGSQTFTGQNKFNNFIDVNNAVTVTSNAGTVPVTFRLNTFTNSSAAAMTITLTTTSAVDGQMTIVRIYDFSGVAEGITWVNTENSTVTAPTTSNGSTTLPLTVGFMYNAQTSKWRCIASA